ncbi:unnamed protein product, partial [Prorocentrum cordatum]
DLFGVFVPVFTCMLGFRIANITDEQAANKACPIYAIGASLRRRAAATLNARVADPDAGDLGLPGFAGHPTFDLADIDKDVGQVFQMASCVPASRVLDDAAVAHGLNEESKLVLHFSTEHYLTIGQTVRVFIGSTSADQPFKAFRAAKNARVLDDAVGFSQSFARLARVEKVDKEVIGLAPDGRCHAARGSYSYEHAIFAAQEAAVELGGKSALSLPFGVIDEAGRMNEGGAAMPLVHIIRGGGHLVVVGDPRQLPPTVMSKHAADVGLALSIFQRLRDSLGEQQGAVITLSRSCRMRPFLTFFPSVAYYNKALVGGLLDPLKYRPLAPSLPWAPVRDVEPEKYLSLAQILKVRSQ